MTTVYLALGSNVGDRRKNLEAALNRLAAEHLEITKKSPLYETAPRGYLDQPWFLNMVAECRTSNAPLQLLLRLMEIEKEQGRDRGGTAIPQGPREIDLDILLFGDAVIQTPRLTVPHPRMLERRFVLEPLLEIAPDLVHPVTHLPIARSLPSVLDQQILQLTT